MGQTIASPPAGLCSTEERDERCGEALDAAMDEVMTAALAAGWHPYEVITAMFEWVVSTACNEATEDSVRGLLDHGAALVAARFEEGEDGDE